MWPWDTVVPVPFSPIVMLWKYTLIKLDCFFHRTNTNKLSQKKRIETGDTITITDQNRNVGYFRWCYLWIPEGASVGKYWRTCYSPAIYGFLSNHASKTRFLVCSISYHKQELELTQTFQRSIACISKKKIFSKQTFQNFFLKQM